MIPTHFYCFCFCFNYCIVIGALFVYLFLLIDIMNKKKCYYVDHLLAFRGGTRILRVRGPK